MTMDEITRFAPAAERFAASLVATTKRFDISTPVRVSMFMAQIAHESGGFHFAREIWGPTDQQRKYDLPNPLAIQLGNTQPGDGLRYRGRGLIQITGRGNAAKCSAFLFGDDRLVKDPSWLESVDGAPMSAGWFWSTHGCNELADSGDFVAVTRRINGGTNGLDDRLAWYAKAKAVW